MNSNKSYYPADEVTTGIESYLPGLIGKSSRLNLEARNGLTNLFASQFTDNSRDKLNPSKFIAYLLEQLIFVTHRPKHHRNSNEFKLIEYLNNIPVFEESVKYKDMLDTANVLMPASCNPSAVLLSIQLVYLLADLKAYPAVHNTIETSESLNFGINPVVDALILMINARIKAFEELYIQEFSCWLEIVCICFNRLDYECTLFFLLEWIDNLNWLKPFVIKRDLLISLYDSYFKGKTFNSALIMFKIFSLRGKIITPGERMSYLQKLLKYPANLLSIMQLQELYYVASNLAPAIHDKFSESAMYFQNSNYYMNKCWEILRKSIAFLRTNLTKEMFIDVCPYIENRITELSCQVSLQSNIYVETLETEHRRINILLEQLHKLSRTDKLTGLHNRRFMDDTIAHSVNFASRHNVNVNLAMIDLDHFKHINDEYGHICGDYMLKEIGKILQKFFRKSDIVIRYGGGEFLIVIFDAGSEYTMKLMERLRITISEHKFKYHNVPLKLTVSIGVASYVFADKTHHNDIESMINDCDNALYLAKHTGRNKVCLNPPKNELDI